MWGLSCPHQMEILSPDKASTADNYEHLNFGKELKQIIQLKMKHEIELFAENRQNWQNWLLNYQVQVCSLWLWPCKGNKDSLRIAYRTNIYTWKENTRTTIDQQKPVGWKGPASSVLSAIVAVKEIKKDNSALCRHPYLSHHLHVCLQNNHFRKLHIIRSFIKGVRCRGKMHWSLESSRKPKHSSKPIEPFPFSQRPPFPEEDPTCFVK